MTQNTPVAYAGTKTPVAYAGTKTPVAYAPGSPQSYRF